MGEVESFFLPDVERCGMVEWKMEDSGSGRRVLFEMSSFLMLRGGGMGSIDPPTHPSISIIYLLFLNK